MTQLNSPPEPPRPYAPIQTPPTSGKAMASMILGIVSIPTCCCYGGPSLICGVLAVVFYFLAQKDMASGSFSQASRGMSLAGLICGILGIVLSFIYWILLAIGLLARFNHWGGQP